MNSSLLEIDDLEITFRQRGGRAAALRAVDGISFRIELGETLGLVGESGSGKSTIGRGILGLLEPSAGAIRFDGEAVNARDLGQRRRFAREIQVVFQDPYNSLDPLRSIGHTLVEPLRAAGIASGRDAERIAAGVLAKVGLPADALQRKPREFSGGQRQRVAIARALVVNPRLIVCDEAISALDLSTQAQVLNLLVDLKEELGVAYLFIAHDLTVVRHVSDRVIVLYRGRVMEAGTAAEVCDEPMHPYSQALWAAAPTHDPVVQRDKRELRLTTVRESASAAAETLGCPFAARCPHVMDVCRTDRPTPVAVGSRLLACHLFDPAVGR